MNIAIFTDFFLPSLGGVQTSIINQRNALEAAGHKVLVIAPCYEGQVPYEYAEGAFRVPSEKLLSFDQHQGFFPWPKAMKKLKATLLERNIEIIHAQTEFSLGLTALKLGRKLSIPTVYTTHTLLWKQVYLLQKHPILTTFGALLFFIIFTQRNLPNAPRLPNERWAEHQWRKMVIAVTLMADAVVSPSHHLAKKVAHPDNAERIKVIPNTTNFSNYPIKPLPTSTTFLWVGRISHEKRPLEFIKAVAIAKQVTNTDFNVIICGRGPLEAECRKAAEGLDNVSFTVINTYEDMPKLYDSASVLVTTSYGFENQPMIIAEALARGRGVIYCDADLTADGLNNGSGLLCGPSSEEIAQAMCRIIENHDKLVMMFKMSILAAERFNERHYLEAIEALYQSILRKPLTKKKL